MTTAFAAPAIRELDHRAVDGLSVTLLWHRDEERLSVLVCDARTGEDFEVEVRPAESPLDVFHHPFAYAALHEAPQAPRPRALSG